VLRLLEHLKVPRLGIIGPWAHVYPHDGVPGPAIGFLQEATRWWDTWLKGIDTGMTREPMLRAFIEDFEPPSTTRQEASGRFIAEETWPSPSIAERTFFLADGRLADAAPPFARLPVRSPLYTGSACGEWMGTGVAGEAPGDQRLDDGLSLVFDSAPLSEAFDVLGFPAVELELSCDAPQGQIAVRLCDVAPDGASVRVSYAALNLAHRAGSDHPRPLSPGETVRLRLHLKACGHRFPSGHRLRLAIATAYWPLVWPARDRATVTIFAGASRLLVPVRRPGAGEPRCEFPPPERSRAAPQTIVRAGRTERSVSFDQIAGTATYVTKGEGGLFGEGVVRFDEIGMTLSHDLTRKLTIAADDPLSAEAVIEQIYVMERMGWTIEIRTSTKLRSNAESFRLTGGLEAYENASLVHERRFDERLARDFL
jgi:predicted acyl esterase